MITNDRCTECGRTYPTSDWERGYAKGYERALSQLVELVEAHSNRSSVDDFVREQAEKLRKEVLHDDH